MTGTVIAREWRISRSFERATVDSEVSLEIVPCPNCACRQFRLILESSDFLARMKGTFRLVRCASCDVVLTNPRPASKSRKLLAPKEHSPSLVENSGWQWLERLALRSEFGYPPQPANPLTKLLAKLAMWKFHARHQRRDWIPFRAPGRLLDVGYESGRFRERMRSLGWTVTGVELSEETSSIDLRTAKQVDTGARLPSDSSHELFDTVTMWNQLGRVSDARECIRAASMLIRPGGLLVIEVPNIESRTFAEFREDWIGLDLPLNLQHFSPKTLRAILPENQLRIVEMQQIGMPTWIKRSAERAVSVGRTSYQTWLSKKDSFWAEQALHSEIADQADCIRMIAERRS